MDRSRLTLDVGLEIYFVLWAIFGGVSIISSWVFGADTLRRFNPESSYGVQTGNWINWPLEIWEALHTLAFFDLLNALILLAAFYVPILAFIGLLCLTFQHWYHTSNLGEWWISYYGVVFLIGYLLSTQFFPFPTAFFWPVVMIFQLLELMYFPTIVLGVALLLAFYSPVPVLVTKQLLVFSRKHPDTNT